MTKITVIYHSADYDGIFCREIARKFLPDAELIGWNFGDPLIPVPEGPLYILDLSPDCLASNDRVVDLIWIDHHKTSIEKYPTNIRGVRIDGVAACRLAWQWFTCVDGNTTYGNVGNSIRAAGVLPMIQDFKNREVNEPVAVRLAGEYDIWDKRDPDTETFQYGLRFVEQGSDFWEALLETDGVGMKAVKDILGHGEICQRYQHKIDASLVKSRSYRLQWEGLNWIVLNTGRFNSLTFAALDVPETGHDALLGYMFNGKAWMVSLYHAKHRTDLDLSTIAVKHGGGGHRGACGFTSETLPWLTPVKS